MRFALLLYEDDAHREAKSDAEVAHCLAYAAAMEKAGILVGGERLRPARCAATVRIREGATHVLDGPYAEAKEQLGGFHLIDVPDRETALAWARRCPSALRGHVALREIAPAECRNPAAPSVTR
jgi:hypothetical protein